MRMLGAGMMAHMDPYHQGGPWGCWGCHSTEPLYRCSPWAVHACAAVVFQAIPISGHGRSMWFSLEYTCNL